VYPGIEVAFVIALGGNSTASFPILKVTCVPAAFGAVASTTLYKLPSAPSNCTVDPLTIPVPVAVNTWVDVSNTKPEVVVCTVS